MNAKENAGQERALSTQVFVANKVELAQYRTILGKIYKQEAYLDSFGDSATEPEKAALKSVLDGDAAKDVEHMRAVMAKMSEHHEERAPEAPLLQTQDKSVTPDKKKADVIADQPVPAAAGVDASADSGNSVSRLRTLGMGRPASAAAAPRAGLPS